MLSNQIHPTLVCSTSCIYISSCHPGRETTNSCCTCNTNTIYYTANSIQSSSCSTFATTNTNTIHWELLWARLAQPCCPMPINSKQEPTIQASWKDRDLDCLSQKNLMIPWPGLPLTQPLKCCILNLSSMMMWQCTSTAGTIIKTAHTSTVAVNRCARFQYM